MQKFPLKFTDSPADAMHMIEIRVNAMLGA